MGNTQWSGQDKKRLKEMYKDGATRAHMAEEFGRSEKAINVQLSKLGILGSGKYKKLKRKHTGTRTRTRGQEAIILAKLLNRYPWLHKYIK